MILALLLSLVVIPDLSGMLRLSNGNGMAQACPIAMDRALTNRHVMNAGARYVWGVDDGEIAHGIVEAESSDDFRDLSVIRPITSTRFPKWYPIAKMAPKVGERVWFIGVDLGNKTDAFAPEVFSSKVTRVFNGTIALDPAGKHGSSGSCVLNEAGEAIAINKGGTDTENSNGVIGIAVGIWGDWLALKPDEAVVEEIPTYTYVFPWSVKK